MTPENSFKRLFGISNGLSFHPSFKTPRDNEVHDCNNLSIIYRVKYIDRIQIRLMMALNHLNYGT